MLLINLISKSPLPDSFSTNIRKLEPSPEENSRNSSILKPKGTKNN